MTEGFAGLPYHDLASTLKLNPDALARLREADRQIERLSSPLRLARILWFYFGPGDGRTFEELDHLDQREWLDDAESVLRDLESGQ